MKNRSGNAIALIIAVFLIVMISVAVIVVLRSKYTKNSSTPNQQAIQLGVQPTGQPTSRPTAQPAAQQTEEEIHGEKFPIRRISIQLSKNAYAPVQGAPGPCQPDLFDPKVTKYHLVKKGGSPSQLYALDSDPNNYPVMMINGWKTENENKIELPSPYEFNYYEFGCASSFSYVAELTKKDQRQALYTHVNHFAFSEDKKDLYLVNNLKKSDGTWELFHRIFNIESNTAIKLPNIDCVTEYGFWQGKRLITYSDANKAENLSTYNTKICIWNINGELLSAFEVPVAWGAANRYFLAEKIGLLPKDPDIFFAYTSKDENRCSLFLIDTNGNIKTREINILDKTEYKDHYYCASPEIQFDFDNFMFSSASLRFKVKIDNKFWSDWKIRT